MRLITSQELTKTPNLNTGQTHPVTAQASPPAASNYRVAVSSVDPKATFGAAREKLFDTDSVRQYASALVNFFPGPVSFDSTKR